MEKSKSQLKREAKQEQREFYKERKLNQRSNGVHMVGENMLFIHTDNPEHGIWLLSKESKHFISAKMGDKKIIDRYINDLIEKAHSQIGN